MDETYTRCVPEGVGPPTRTSTSPTSAPNGLLMGVSTNVRPPSSERATWVPLACQATYTVPSERSTATDGSVALDWPFGETCSVKPKMVWARAGGESRELGSRCGEKIQPAKTTATDIRIRSVWGQLSSDMALLRGSCLGSFSCEWRSF